MKFINKKQTTYLKDVVIKNRLVQSYLFCGPTWVGKTEAVFDFISRVNKKDDVEFISKGSDPDVIIVSPEIDEKNGKIRKKDISITQVKDAVKKIRYYAYESRYKFLVIKEAEKMTITAANSLLKLIEESTPDTIVVLISNNELKTLPTIRSRCQIVRFGLASIEDVTLQLKYENVEFSKEDLKEISVFSQGRIIRAREFLLNKSVFEFTKNSLEKFKNSLKKGVVSGLNLSEELYVDKEKLKIFLDEATWYLRNLLKEQIAKNADIRVIRKILVITNKIVQLRADISHSGANQRLQLDNFFVQL